MVFLRPIRSIIHSVTNTPAEGDEMAAGERAKAGAAAASVQRRLGYSDLQRSRFKTLCWQGHRVGE